MQYHRLKKLQFFPEIEPEVEDPMVAIRREIIRRWGSMGLFNDLTGVVSLMSIYDVINVEEDYYL